MVQEDLDILLYRWLSERDEARAEQQFTQYFRAAFPAMCRYLRSLRTDPTAAQDIAQQALIKFFNHFGKERRTSDERLREAISTLQPLDFGALHERRVESWRRQVSGCRDAAISFRPSRDRKDSPGPWNQTREEINGRIPLLTREGTRFIGEVRSRIGPKLNSFLASESRPGGSDGQSREDAEPEEVFAVIDEAEAERFVALCFDYAHNRDSSQVDCALDWVGVVAFLTHINTIRGCLPRLEIPSNRLLYTIAKRQLLDRLRSTRHQTVHSVEQLADRADDGILGVFEAGDAGDRQDRGEEIPSSALDEDSQPVDTEVEARYRAFLEFLRAPLTRAEGAVAAAATEGKAKVEQARVDSLRTKYDRLLSVLAALQEDPPPTEEQIARREGLSRNQVKYVIERIREEFNHFFPDLARQTDGRRRRQGGDSAASEAVRAD